MSLVQSNNRDRKVLFQTEQFEVVSIEWQKNSTSDFHNHGWSQCLVQVQEGVFENHLDMGSKTEIQILEAGQVLSTPVGSQHKLICLSDVGKTLHIYTPKIKELADSQKFSIANTTKIKNSLALQEPTSLAQIQNLFEEFKQESISTFSPFFMNQLFSGIMPQMLLAEDFINHSKTTLATFEASSVHSSIEVEVIHALGAQLGWSVDNRYGVTVPGGSAANFMAMHCAREYRIPNSKKYGMKNSNFKIFVSDEAHYSFKKGAAVLGIGTENIVSVPVDSNGKMNTEILKEKIKDEIKFGATPLMIVATAGTTVLGAFDDIPSLYDICKKHNMWLHVDAAWGGPAIFSNKLKYLTKGIELADSVTFDAHKLLGANLTSSFFMTQHKDILLQANDVSGADYLFHSDDPFADRGKISWQCGRSADAVSFWAIWKSLGTKGIGSFVDTFIDIRDEVLPWIKNQKRLELVAEPSYLNICVRIASPYEHNDANWSKKVRESLKENDKAFVNYSINKDGTFLRLILAHPFLKGYHIKQILEWALKVR